MLRLTLKLVAPNIHAPQDAAPITPTFASRFRLTIAAALIVIAGGPLAAQQRDPLPAQQRDPRAAQPERPTVATHAGTVAPGFLEFETGVEFDRLDVDHLTIGTLVTKIGVTSHLQFSIFASVVAPTGSAGGVGDVATGFKWRIADGHSILGDFAILPSVKFPTGSLAQGSGTGTTDATLLLISSRDAGPVHIDLNAGYTRRSGDGTNAPRSSAVWTASFGGTFTELVGWTAEFFGYPGTEGPSGAAPTAAFLAGPTFAVRNWFVVDIGVIVPITGAQPRAAYAGFVYNVGRIWGTSAP